jgi:hypothetical protein
VIVQTATVRWFRVSKLRALHAWINIFTHPFTDDWGGFILSKHNSCNTQPIKSCFLKLVPPHGQYVPIEKYLQYTKICNNIWVPTFHTPNEKSELLYFFDVAWKTNSKKDRKKIASVSRASGIFGCWCKR